MHSESRSAKLRTLPCFVVRLGHAPAAVGPVGPVGQRPPPRAASQRRAPHADRRPRPRSGRRRRGRGGRRAAKWRRPLAAPRGWTWPNMLLQTSRAHGMRRGASGSAAGSRSPPLARARTPRLNSAAQGTTARPPIASGKAFHPTNRGPCNA